MGEGANVTLMRFDIKAIIYSWLSLNGILSELVLKVVYWDFYIINNILFIIKFIIIINN